MRITILFTFFCISNLLYGNDLEVAHFVSIDGSVIIHRSGNILKVSENDKIYLNDIVKTGPNSSCNILITDIYPSSFWLGSNGDFDTKNLVKMKTTDENLEFTYSEDEELLFVVMLQNKVEKNLNQLPFIKKVHVAISLKNKHMYINLSKKSLSKQELNFVLEKSILPGLSINKKNIRIVNVDGEGIY